MQTILRTGRAVAFLLISASAIAAVPAEEAKQLGTTLTPWGAEKAGNKEGTITAYSPTELLKPPPGYNPKTPGIRPDPYAAEKPLFSITAQNADRYADQLSDGVKAMLKRYPTFRLDVYPTHRTAQYPAYVQENSLKNAIACKTFNAGLQLEGCFGGVPFPIPKTGNEVMWNHLAHYTSPSYLGTMHQYMIDSSGTVNLQGENRVWMEYPFFYGDRKSVMPGDSPYWMVRADTVAPARKAGDKVVIVDYVDSLKQGRRAWQYLPGQRRVKMSPDLQYDTPNPQSGGSAVMDETQLFLGAQDRYDFKLIGKREMLIPYNTFKYLDQTVCPNAKRLTKNHYNPDCMRWELHRVWEIDATLRPGMRHLYPKRKFYFDEDMPGGGLGDSFDSSGNPYRVSMVTYVPWYETPDQGNTDLNLVFDLSTGAYMIGFDSGPVGGLYPNPERPATRFFTGDAMAADGVR
jgi:hypothetical protein